MLIDVFRKIHSKSIDTSSFIYHYHSQRFVVEVVLNRLILDELLCFASSNGSFLASDSLYVGCIYIVLDNVPI